MCYHTRTKQETKLGKGTLIRSRNGISSVPIQTMISKRVHFLHWIIEKYVWKIILVKHFKIAFATQQRTRRTETSLANSVTKASDNFTVIRVLYFVKKTGPGLGSMCYTLVRAQHCRKLSECPRAKILHLSLKVNMKVTKLFTSKSLYNYKIISAFSLVWGKLFVYSYRMPIPEYTSSIAFGSFPYLLTRYALWDTGK